MYHNTSVMTLYKLATMLVGENLNTANVKFHERKMIAI